jgi:Flp pilus assembly protein TadD
MKEFAVVLALLVAALAVRAEGPDDQYVAIYNLIKEADKLSSEGQTVEALPKYLEAQAALQAFQKGYRDWNTKIISFRLRYVQERITALSPNSPAVAPSAPVAPPPAVTAPVAPAPAPAASPAAPAPPVTAPVAPALATTAPAPVAEAPTQPAQPAPPADWENQLGTLKEQVRQLQADKGLLEAKLKEALSAQPAAVDPRELAKAEEKIRGLTKENDLLKASLTQEKAKPAPALDTKALDEARLALADANRRLAEQTKAANAALLERTELQNKLNTLAPSAATAAELDRIKKALADANVKLTEQAKVTSALLLDKEALQGRVKALNTDAEAAAALRAENQLLKKQVADLKAAPAPASKSEDASRKLAEVQAQLAALQSDKELLRLEKTALENRVKQMSAQTNAPAASPAAAKAADAAKIKQLERERDELKKSLTAANKELYSRKGQAAAAHLADLENQLTILHTRLQVYEARQVPYTAEEIALFNRPETKLAQPAQKAGKASVKELPPGTVTLIAEAQRAYANKQYDKAEQAYVQVLQQDKNNVPTLANLAAIELDRGHLDTAEINIKQAIALAPDDAYSQFVLGRLRFAQKKYDEAIDALSRAAGLDPQDAQIQNFLGLALSEKGLRGPAETALRKAIQLDPGYGSAHNNLAVVYISQQPPLVELARWHYQKALAAGQPHNPDLEKMLETKAPATGPQ